MYCILVTGIRAAGKNSAARFLGERLDLPAVSKDGIKELLFDHLGFQSRAEKVKGTRRGYRLAGIIITVFLLAVLAAWRLWPRALSDLIPIEEHPVVRLACGVMTNQAGSIEHYALDGLLKGQEEFDGVLELLDEIRFRPDFRNLLPWPAGEAQVNGEGDTVSVVLVWGNREGDSCSLSFLGEDLACLSVGGSEGFSLFHPVDGEPIRELADYVKTHGKTK